MGDHSLKALTRKLIDDILFVVKVEVSLGSNLGEKEV